MEIMANVKAQDPSINYPFENHPFGAVTFNLGPVVITKTHKDCMDVPWAWCAITSLGDYDHTQGGHLVLWELGLVIEFPPYSTIFIPSALISHSNIKVQPGETRASITQYNSEGLFRWAAFDYTLKHNKEKSGKSWWDEPSHMFSRYVDSGTTLNLPIGLTHFLL